MVTQRFTEEARRSTEVLWFNPVTPYSTFIVLHSLFSEE
jgi:hypothetical protein